MSCKEESRSDPEFLFSTKTEIIQLQLNYSFFEIIFKAKLNYSLNKIIQLIKTQLKKPP